MRASRIAGLALAIAAVGLFATSPGMANCGNPLSIFQGFGSGGYVTGCGTDSANEQLFFWQPGYAVQRLGGLNATITGTAGNDSGAVATVADTVLTPGGAPGDYSVIWDWNNFGEDGCPLNKLEPDTGACGATTTSIPPNNFVFAGTDTGNRLNVKSVVLSVDGNELYQFYILDQAGAPSVDGDPCNGDGNSFVATPPACGDIPAPALTSLGACDAGGCTLNVTVNPHTVPFIDDCNVANSKAIDCPRNIYVGRELMVRRAPCNATDAAHVGTFDNRAFQMDVTAGTITANFVRYAPEDLNLNGVQDGAETGFTPLIVSGNAAQTVAVHIPKIAGATDCAYLGVALLMDSAPVAGGCGGADCEPVVTPLVSVNPAPISLDTATPAADRVIDLVASKTAGKAAISWDTTAELTTAGFNVIGVRKNGSEVKLNSSLITAKQGTTGQGASYSASYGGGDLKGSSEVYVELVKTNGAKERFGPVSF